jgi:hypothetical protein
MLFTLGPAVLKAGGADAEEVPTAEVDARICAAFCVLLCGACLNIGRGDTGAR